MNDRDLITIAAAFLGSLGSGVAGWWDSHEPFDARKFMGTIWRAIFAAMSFAFTNQFVDVKGAIWVWAFLGGAGVDVLGNRLQGGLVGKSDYAKIQEQLGQLQGQIEAIARLRTETERGPS